MIWFFFALFFDLIFFLGSPRWFPVVVPRCGSPLWFPVVVPRWNFQLTSCVLFSYSMVEALSRLGWSTLKLKWTLWRKPGMDANHGAKLIYYKKVHIYKLSTNCICQQNTHYKKPVGFPGGPLQISCNLNSFLGPRKCDYKSPCPLQKPGTHHWFFYRMRPYKRFCRGPKTLAFVMVLVSPIFFVNTNKSLIIII